MFTIGNYIFLGFLVATLLVISIMIGICTDSVALGISSSIMRLTIFFLSWLRNWNAVWKLKGVDVND